MVSYDQLQRYRTKAGRNDFEAFNVRGLTRSWSIYYLSIYLLII